jgi:hypothetical protein
MVVRRIKGITIFDPHGYPIPDKAGVLPETNRRPLLNSVEGCRYVILGVNEAGTAFLNYLTELNIALNDRLQVEKILNFISSMKIRCKNSETAVISTKVADKILVTCVKPNCGCKPNS